MYQGMLRRATACGALWLLGLAACVGKAPKQEVDTRPLFTVVSDAIPEVDQEIKSYEVFDINQSRLSRLMLEKPDNVTIGLPSTQLQDHVMELRRVEIFSAGTRVVTSSTNAAIEYEVGVYYRGQVRGQPGSRVALSIFADHIVGSVSSKDLGNYSLARLESNKRTTTNRYLFFPAKQLASGASLACAMKDDGGYEPRELQPPNGNSTGAPGDCVDVYIEIDDDLVTAKGGATSAANYATAIFNEVATLYEADGINLELSEIFAWDTPSPYTSSDAQTRLAQFQQHRGDYNGALGQLLTTEVSGGIAAGFNGLCSTKAEGLSVSGVSTTFQTVPTYSFTVMVVAHELGHTLGSRHTHACVWNGDNTAIDGCAGFVEGGCSLPGIPAQGGTIMSYCHVTSAGVNFNLGFGPQPANLIRNRIAGAQCLDQCGGGGPGPGPGGTCQDNEIAIEVTLDAFGSETTWSFADKNGAVIDSGGPYQDKVDGTVETKTVCVANGCYDFTIEDKYGDGMCCKYGNGSYEIKDQDGNVLLTGGSFADSETQEICIGNTPPSGTCDTLNLAIAMDNYPEEVSWRILDNDGNLVEQGGPYGNVADQATVVETPCLAKGCYTLEMADAYGDGICCSYGNGSYVLTDQGGNELAKGAQYGATESSSFCLN